MPRYQRPDVYVERKRDSAPPVDAVGTSVAGFTGITHRGRTGKPIWVTSWTDFIRKCAEGLDSPFKEDADLPYAVRAFFDNGGTQLYINRIVGENAEKATAEVGADGDTILEALSVGEWGNEITIQIEENEDDTELFDIIVEIDGEEVEIIAELSDDEDDENYFEDVINDESDFIQVDTDAGGLEEEEDVEFSGGDDDIENIDKADWVDELNEFDVIENVSIMAVPGQTSNDVQQGLLDYCEGRGDCFAIVDPSVGEDVQGYNEEKDGLGSHFGAYYAPNLYTLDPAGGGRRLVPPSGFIAGDYARTDSERGVHKAPAGVEHRLLGAVDVETEFTAGDMASLNSNNVNCIVEKDGVGIVTWGARLITPHLDRVYVSDMRFDIMVEQSCYEATDWVIFEPNTPDLWERIITSIEGFLYNLWEQGMLFGETPEEAYYVKCDEELNPPEVREDGRVIAEVGYAKTKPAEFFVIRFAQKTQEQ